MFVRVEAALREAVAGFDPACLDGPAARRAVEQLSRMERLCAAAKAAGAARVAECSAWKGGADRSAAHWLARTTGTTVGAAVTTLQTAESLRTLPATREAFERGDLSLTQAAEIASAATPSNEADLLSVADDLHVLKDRCRAARMAAEPDLHAAIHRTRSLRHWTDPDGAFRLMARLTASDGAVVLSALKPLQEEAFQRARKAGRPELTECYAADALVELAKGAKPQAATIRAVVPEPAFRRGHAEPDERCEIVGIGRVPVAAIQDLLPNASVTAVSSDIRTVVHLGRQVTAKQRAALEVRDPECAVPGCHETERLEIDHRTGWALTKRTELDDLVRLCHFHHAQKTREGYRITGRPGRWSWEPP